MLKTCRLRPTESGFSRPRAGEGAGVFPFLTVLFRKLFPVSEASLWVWVSTLKGQGLALPPGQAPPLRPSFTSEALGGPVCVPGPHWFCLKNEDCTFCRGNPISLFFFFCLF